jgi:hypothetical protein
MSQGQVQSGLLEGLVQTVVVFQYEGSPFRNNKKYD